jgi:hypothetical protein
MPRVAPVLLFLLVLAGCGGGGGGGDPDRLTLTTPKVSPPAKEATPEASKAGKAPEQTAPGHTGPITAREKAVVRGWSEALRHGDVERAVGFWEIPAIAANGGQPVRLPTRRAVRFWNSSLPCGAKLESVERDARYVLATFVLTERPGKGSCGTGVGHRARTLFLVRGKKIVQWLRATDPPTSDDKGGTTS